MNKSNKTVLAVVIVIVLIGAGYILLKPAKSNAPSNNSKTSSNNSATDSSKAAAVTITYDGSGFTSSATSVNSGDTVKVFNNSDQDLAFDSDPHPVHTDDPELNAGDIAPGQSKTFTVTKKGTWGYHNHLDSSQHGEITVK